MNKPIIWIVIGTRPECIKQAPLYKAISKNKNFSVKLVGTGQHKDLLDLTLADYDLSLDYSFQSMLPGQNLAQLSSKVISGFEELVNSYQKPDGIIVQGDTTTACFSSITGHQLGIEIFHNEAGLRTGDETNPFPEETNRKIIATLASMHFTPTIGATKNLIKEDISSKDIHLVGNTGR